MIDRRRPTDFEVGMANRVPAYDINNSGKVRWICIHEFILVLHYYVTYPDYIHEYILLTAYAITLLHNTTIMEVIHNSYIFTY